MIHRHEILKGREKDNPLSALLENNLDTLLARVNTLRLLWGKPMKVTSGYRPAAVNSSVGGAAKSKHLTCEAIDIHDPTQELSRYLLANQGILADIGLYLEHPDDTPTWCHLQISPSPSGMRVFRAKPLRAQGSAQV